MGAPANQGYIPVVNGINFNAPRVPATTTQAPQQNYTLNDFLGLSDTKYDGLQSVGDTGYLYKDNMMYEPYTVGPDRYGYRDQYGMVHYADSYGQAGFGGNPNTDASGNFILNPGGKNYNIVDKGEIEGTIYRGDQAFRPVKNLNIEGFTYDSDENIYNPSIAEFYANRPTYQGTDLSLAEPLISLMSPSPDSYAGGFGAGRFLGGTDGILGGLVDSTDNG